MTTPEQDSATATPAPNPAAEYLKASGPAGLDAAVKAGQFRSLTNEAILHRLKSARDQELNSCSEHEAVTINVPKMKNGKMELDEEGFAVLVEKKVRKRDLIVRKWDAKVKRLGLSF